MSSINFQRIYPLSEEYENIRNRANEVLGRYLGDPSVISFNDRDRSVTFSSERLIPTTSKNRPRVMLLFSNPHPHSIHLGMFLSPNTKGRGNPFWQTMRDAGWITIPEATYNPQQLVDLCLKADYQGPFEFVFYCYYSFPTSYPEDIQKIFGKQYFNSNIEPTAINEFNNTIHQTSVEAVVTFNKDIFNHVANDRIDRYINRLKEGELIQSRINGIDRTIPLYLSFPTGWRYDKQYKQHRKANLDLIKAAICERIKIKNCFSVTS